MVSIVSITCFCLLIQIFAQIVDRQLLCDYWVLETGDSRLTVFSPKSWIYYNVKTLPLLHCPLSAFVVSLRHFLPLCYCSPDVLLCCHVLWLEQRKHFFLHSLTPPPFPHSSSTNACPSQPTWYPLHTFHLPGINHYPLFSMFPFKLHQFHKK